MMGSNNTENEHVDRMSEYVMIEKCCGHQQPEAHPKARANRTTAKTSNDHYHRNGNGGSSRIYGGSGSGSNSNGSGFGSSKKPSLCDTRLTRSYREPVTCADVPGNRPQMTSPTQSRLHKISLVLSHWSSEEQACVSDGPLSVQEASDTPSAMMNNSQEPPNNQSSARSGSSAANHVAGESTSVANTPTREQAKNDTGQAQVNGTGGTSVQGLLSESRVILKNLPLEEVLNTVRAIVGELDKLEDYQRGEGMRYQKMLGDFYWDYSSHRHVIGDALSDCGYAALTVKMLKTMNALGIFKNDDIWFPTYYTYMTAWNYSDASDKLAKSLADADAVRLLTLNLGHKPYLSAMQSKNVYYVLKASLSTLHNIARSPDVRHYFKENKTSEVIMPFIAQKDEFLRAISMLILAYIVEEEDNAHLICDTGTIGQIVKWLEKATENAGKRRFRGFAPWELTQGLDNLAVNDTNKMKVIEAGALPVFLKMLQHDDPKEQAATGHCLWTLAFDKTARDKIKEYEGLVPALETLAKGENAAVKKAVEGALWIIKGENDPNTSSRPKSAMKSKSHIFISYSWNEKEIVKQIREKLRLEGYKVWIDYEQMGGSTLQAMAEAVENAAVVLVCMSEKYKESPNCRTEAEYMFQMRKDYIPLMLQKKYRPDGWLGAILGAKLFFDFSGKYPFEKTVSGLQKELRGRGQFSRSMDSVDEPDAQAIDGTAAASTPVHSGNSHKVPNHQAISHEVHSMTRDDVTQWLIRHQLDICIAPMAQLDGKLLWQLKVMKDEAPQFFFQLLDTKLNLSFVDLLKFTAAIDELH